MTSRRDFMSTVALVTAGVVGHISLPVLADDAPVSPVDIGSIEQYKADGIVDTFVAKHRFFVVTHDKTIRALSSRCTHKNKALKSDGTQLRCPAHGSLFELDGQMTKGPAKIGLPRSKITLDGDTLRVDPSVEFSHQAAAEPESFVKLAE